MKTESTSAAVPSGKNVCLRLTFFLAVFVVAVALPFFWVDRPIARADQARCSVETICFVE
jgi:hypothetical protein